MWESSTFKVAERIHKNRGSSVGIEWNLSRTGTWRPLSFLQTIDFVYAAVENP